MSQIQLTTTLQLGVKYTLLHSFTLMHQLKNCLVDVKYYYIWSQMLWFNQA